MEPEQTGPLVSVIIPLYNAEKYIAEAIAGISGQTYTRLEIIVVNDGSTDRGEAIIRELMISDRRIRLFCQENKGQCAASNFGFAQARGKYIKFFDADDILTPQTIARQVDTLEGTGRNAASYIDYIRFYDDDLSTINRYKLPDLINKDCTPVEYFTYHGSPQMFQCGIWLFHKDLFAETGLWDERLSLINDTEFFPRIFKYLKVLYHATDGLLYYRTNFKSGSLSQTISSKSMRSAVMSVDLMAQHIRSIEDSEIIEKIIAQSYVEILEMSYPSQPGWTKIIQRRLKKFKTSQYQLTGSGKFYNILLKFFGWKAAKKLQAYYYKIKY